MDATEGIAQQGQRQVQRHAELLAERAGLNLGDVQIPQMHVAVERNGLAFDAGLRVEAESPGFEPVARRIRCIGAVARQR